MEYYFDNDGIIKNLPAQPVNKTFQTGMYVAIGLAILLGGACIWLAFENARLASLAQEQRPMKPYRKDEENEAAENEENNEEERLLNLAP